MQWLLTEHIPCVIIYNSASDTFTCPSWQCFRRFLLRKSVETLCACIDRAERNRDEDKSQTRESYCNSKFHWVIRNNFSTNILSLAAPTQRRHSHQCAFLANWNLSFDRRIASLSLFHSAFHNGRYKVQTDFLTRYFHRHIPCYPTLVQPTAIRCR